jgi:hypothetical protein
LRVTAGDDCLDSSNLIPEQAVCSRYDTAAIISMARQRSVRHRLSLEYVPGTLQSLEPIPETASAKYEFFCQPDGRFNVPDVAAGTYILKARVTAPAKNPEEPKGLGEEIGSVQFEVTVPEQTTANPDAQVDLGEIEVTVK